MSPFPCFVDKTEECTTKGVGRPLFYRDLSVKKGSFDASLFRSQTDVDPARAPPLLPAAVLACPVGSSAGYRHERALLPAPSSIWKSIVTRCDCVDRPISYDRRPNVFVSHHPTIVSLPRGRFTDDTETHPAMNIAVSLPPIRNYLPTCPFCVSSCCCPYLFRSRV